MVYRQGGRLVMLQLRINQDFLKLAKKWRFLGMKLWMGTTQH